MDTTTKQEITIHQALHQIILVMGGERNLVLMLGVIAGVFIFSLAQLAKYDPMLSKTGKRHMKYKKYYPASATPFAPNRTIQ